MDDAKVLTFGELVRALLEEESELGVARIGGELERRLLGHVEDAVEDAVPRDVVTVDDLDGYVHENQLGDLVEEDDLPDWGDFVTRDDLPHDLNDLASESRLDRLEDLVDDLRMALEDAQGRIADLERSVDELESRRS